MRIENFLSSDAFTIVNKKLAKLIGIGKAIYLQELISQRKRFKQDKFYFTQENMEEELGIAYKTQQRYSKELEELGLISIEREGLPARNWYTINDEKIYQILNGETSAVKVSEPCKSKCPDSSYISNNTDINKNSSNEEFSDDVADNTTDDIDDFVKNLPAVPKKKEKSSAKKERKEYGDKDINHLIRRLKDECDGLNIAYDKTDDRMFAHHILTGKEYGEFCEKIQMSREGFAVFILNMSNQKQLYTTACAGPKSIYQNYPKVFNMAKKMYEKTTPVVLDDL